IGSEITSWQISRYDVYHPRTLEHVVHGNHVGIVADAGHGSRLVKPLELGTLEVACSDHRDCDGSIENGVIREIHALLRSATQQSNQAVALRETRKSAYLGCVPIWIVGSPRDGGFARGRRLWLQGHQPEPGRRSHSARVMGAPA